MRGIKFDLPVKDYYLHIKTDNSEIKNTKLYFRTEDWAGNVGEQSVDTDINIDRVAPRYCAYVDEYRV